MSISIVEIDHAVQEHIRCVVPVTLSQSDLEFFVNWFVHVGIETVRYAMKKHPELTLGQLMQSSMHKH